MTVYKWLNKIYSSLTRARAKHCLLALITEIQVALDELHHSLFPTAHMDLRLPNICFTTSYHVKLIDLDRCRDAEGPIDLSASIYTTSDMYTCPENSKWNNYNLDWKALGMIICFVLDDALVDNDYHDMISLKKVHQGLTSEPFVKCLLESGKLLYLRKFLNIQALMSRH